MHFLFCSEEASFIIKFIQEFQSSTMKIQNVLRFKMRPFLPQDLLDVIFWDLRLQINGLTRLPNKHFFSIRFHELGWFFGILGDMLGIECVSIASPSVRGYCILDTTFQYFLTLNLKKTKKFFRAHSFTALLNFLRI